MTEHAVGAEWHEHHCDRPDPRTDRWGVGDLWRCPTCEQWYVVSTYRTEFGPIRRCWHVAGLRQRRRIRKIERGWR